MRAVFWAAALPGLLCILVVSFGLKETQNKLQRRDKKPIFGAAARLPTAFYYVLAAIALFSIGNSSDMFLVLRAQSIGIPASHAPLLGLVFNVTYTAASWPAGRLSDRVSRSTNAGMSRGVMESSLQAC